MSKELKEKFICSKRWNIKSIFLHGHDAAPLPSEGEGVGRFSLFIIKYLQALTHRAESEMWGREGESATGGGRLLSFSPAFSFCVSLCCFIYSLTHQSDRVTSQTFHPWVVLVFTLTPSSFPHTHRESSGRPHDEGGGPAEPPSFLHVWRDGIHSTSAPGRTQAHPQCLVRGL